MMTTITYFWIKSKTYLRKISVIKNNAVTRTISFINISSFRYINSNIIEHLYITHNAKQIICTKIHLKQLADSIFLMNNGSNNCYHVMKF